MSCIFRYILVFIFAGIVNISLSSQVSAKIFLIEGQSVAGSTVSTINNPFTNEDGKVGCSFSLDNGDRGIWFDTTYIHLNSEIDSPILTSIEFTIGIGSEGRYIFSPSQGGDDAVWGQDGLILVEPQQAPGFQPGVVNTFNSRPQMTGDANGYWVAGVNFSGGSVTEERVLYKRIDTGSIEKQYVGGDTLSSGLILEMLNFDYCVSDNDSFILHDCTLIAPSSSDGVLLHNGDSILARESEPTGDGDNWDAFDWVSINNQGNYVWSGNTDGVAATNEYIALNGNIVLREGDMFAGITLTSPMLVRGLSINDFGKIVFVLSLDGVESIFETDMHDFNAQAKVIASVGDTIDVDGNLTGDYIIDDFEGVSGMTIDLSEHNFVYAELDLLPVGGGGAVEAIVRFNLDCVEYISLIQPYDNITSKVPVYAEAITIKADNIIGPNTNVGYDASKGIILEAGFEVQHGALFEAKIDGCGNITGPIEP